MFGLSLSEIFIIALVALIVIGPERLPKTARALGLLVGRAQRYVNDIKSDIEREMHVEDLKKFKDDVASNVTQVKSSVEGEISSIADPLKKISNPLDAVKTEVSGIEKQLKSDLNPLPDLSELKLDKSVSEPLDEVSKLAAAQSAKSADSAVKAKTATVAGAVSEVEAAGNAVADVKVPSQAFSTNPSASFEPAAPKALGKKDPIQSSVTESLVYPDVKDESVASATDVVQQRWAVSADDGAVVEPTQKAAGIYDGPTFEPLESPELSPEEREARDEAWAVFVEENDSPVNADSSLEGLAMWEQMPKDRLTEELVSQEQEGQDFAVADKKDKNNSKSDDGDLNV